LEKLIHSIGGDRLFEHIHQL